jgi:hypothetical protein
MVGWIVTTGEEFELQRPSGCPIFTHSLVPAGQHDDHQGARPPSASLQTFALKVVDLWLALRATPYCPIPTQRDGGWLVRHGWIEIKINK